MKKNIVKITGFCLLVVALSVVSIVKVVQNGSPAQKIMVIDTPAVPMGNIVTEEIEEPVEVYWDDSDMYYHYDKTCSELTGKNISVGTVEEAEAEGKTSGCEQCAE